LQPCPCTRRALLQTGALAGKSAKISCGLGSVGDVFAFYWVAEGLQVSAFYHTKKDNPTEADYQQIYQQGMSVLTAVH
jgi:hypothetical protein